MFQSFWPWFETVWFTIEEGGLREAHGLRLWDFRAAWARCELWLGYADADGERALLVISTLINGHSHLPKRRLGLANATPTVFEYEAA